MAALTADRVVVELEAKVARYNSDVNQSRANFERNLAAMSRAGSATERRVEAAFRGISTSAATMNQRLAAVGLGTLVSASSVSLLVSYADRFNRLQNQLRVTGLEGANVARVYDLLEAAAKRNFAPLDALVSLYGRASQASKELGATEGDLLRFSERIAQGLRVAGTTPAAASGALLQLGQLLGSARVQAEEFNSINEGARPILQAVADGIEEAGGSVSKLKQLVNDGAVSNKAFFDGFMIGSKRFERQIASSVPTAADALQNLQTSLTTLAGKFDTATGFSRDLVKAIDDVSSAVDLLGNFFGEAADDIKRLTDFLDRLRRALNDGAEAFGRFTGLAKIGQAIDVTLGRRSGDPKTEGASLADLESQFKELNDEIRQLQANPITLDLNRQRIESLKLELADIEKAIAKVRAAGGDVRIGPMNDYPPAPPAGVSTPSGAGPVSLKNYPVGSDAKAGSVYETATKYRGLTERANDDQIRTLLRRTGGEFSGELRVWCADFVNAILAERGLKGTGSRAARSFLNYGEATTNPNVGDIVVLKRGAAGSGSGHVGFFEGYDERGRVKVFGGNQSEGVNSQTYDPSRILGFRKAPSAEGQVTARLESEKKQLEFDRKQRLDAGRSVEDIDARTAAIDREIEAIRRRGDAQAFFDAESERANFIREEKRKLEDEELELSADRIAQIEADADRYVAAKQKEFDAEQRLKNIKTDAEAVRDAQDFFAENATGAFTDIVTGATTAEQAMKRLLSTLVEAAIQAALLGKGPLAGIFGTAMPGGGTGGLFGALFGGLPGRALGGPVTKGHAYITGERDRELFIPDSSGKVVPIMPNLPTMPNIGAPQQRVEVVTRVTTDDDRFNAYVDGRATTIATPLAARSGVQAVKASDNRWARNQSRYAVHGH